MDILGVPPMPRSWSLNAMKASLTPEQFAAAQAAPEGERLAVGWTLLMVRGSDDFKAGKPVNMFVALPDGQNIAYRFQGKADGFTAVRRVGVPREPAASAGFQTHSPPDVLMAAVKLRWQPYGYKFEGPWQVGDLMKLHKVLLTLSPRELAHLRDITFKRGGEDPKRAGVYEAHGDTASITYFDGAFSHDGSTFVGEGQPYSERTLYHEIGHALLGWADRVVWRQLDDAVKLYNQTIDRYNAASWSDQHKMSGELDAARKDYEAAKARFKYHSDLHYVEQRFKGRPSPTEYGETNAGEFHAEAYSVFKTEPERLAEFDTDLHGYFASGDYLKHWQQGTDGKWAPVAVPGDVDAPVGVRGDAGPAPVVAPIVPIVPGVPGGVVPIRTAARRPAVPNAAAAALARGFSAIR